MTVPKAQCDAQALESRTAQEPVCLALEVLKLQACKDNTSSRDSGTPTAPLRICALLAPSPALLPMSRTQSCSKAAASSFTPYLHTAAVLPYTVSMQFACA